MKSNKKFVTCKIETTYGTDATPAVGTDDLLVENFSLQPNIRFVERNVARPYFGSQEEIKIGETFMMEFDIPITGAGGVATVPPFGPMMRICAMAQTITPTTGPVTYSMISDSEESGSIYFYWDGVRHKALGCRGSVEWRYAEGNIGLRHFTVEGLYGGLAEAALGGTPSWSAPSPVGITKANTTFSLHGYAAALQSLTITQGNQNDYINRPNSEKIHFSDRKTKGKVVIECPKPTAKDFIAICRAGTLGALDLTHGTADGNKSIIAADYLQLKSPNYSESNGIVMLSMDLILRQSSAGNDEFTEATQ